MKLHKRECSGRATVTGKFKGDDSGSSSYPFTILSHTKGSRGGLEKMTLADSCSLSPLSAFYQEKHTSARQAR